MLTKEELIAKLKIYPESEILPIMIARLEAQEEEKKDK